MLLFCYFSQQFDEEDEDETDGKPNPAAAAKAALGMILCQFRVKVALTGYDGDIPAFIPKKYFLMVNFEALSEFCLWMKSKNFLM